MTRSRDPRRLRRLLLLVIAGVAGLLSASAPPVRALQFPRAAQQAALHEDPQRRSRPCQCQFGVDLPTGLLGYRIGQLLPPEDPGHHSYGAPSAGEHNGQIYTCVAGFVDTSHLRAGVDWLAHLVVLLDQATSTGAVVDFGPDGGGVRLIVRRAPRPLSRENLLRLAQRVAYERLTWHEVMSWYYHPPTHVFSEQQSTFSPEDASSNFLGTEVGRRAIELVEATGQPFEDAVDVALKERLVALGAVRTAEDTRQNFARVDRHQLGPISGAAWFDSSVLFWDPRYLFKRNLDVLPTVRSWRVPAGAEVGCERSGRGYVGHVPSRTVRGTPLTELYEWQFTPERQYFRVESGPDATVPTDPRFVHSPQPALVTNRTLPAAIALVAEELAVQLGVGFDAP